MIKLYCFGESGNAYKAALPLEFSGLAWEPVFVDFFNGETRTDAFRRINPMGEVPVMIAPCDPDDDSCVDTLVMTQSGVMQQWISDHTKRFGGTDPIEDREILRWVLWDNHKLSSMAGALRFQMNFLPEEKRSVEVIDWLKGRLRGAFATLDAHLASRDWIAGAAPTNADFSCCGYLYYPEPFGFDRAEWPNIARWLDGIAALPGWKHPYDLMPGNPSERAGKEA
ncbi:glutathione S-transferase [Mesobaculum littorinae]|uniref:Glutathione S-transferase n=1 Tax=Mesobaculum littorinae TaxID=2486419 RepID=A0A438AI61_9RHOB|nr:glutathione S-transferase [Mesobaculum littorinae]RVV98433.1 glutathione S-transferase [Mesobaculum littorinae]